MSSKLTLASHRDPDGSQPAWNLSHDALEAGVVYLELQGVAVDFTTRGNMEHGPGTVVLCLPVDTARQLGLHTAVPAEDWELVRNT
ncbi:hypothetical protein BZM26_00085 [Paraburkholderia strydomiana]|nr:hypothetical protein BZM26_00085 [Paraburkholderia strydomiana]